MKTLTVRSLSFQQRESDEMSNNKTSVENDVYVLSANQDSLQGSAITKESCEYADYSHTPLYIAMKPLMVSLKMIGLHHVRSSPASKATTTFPSSSCRLPSALEVSSLVET